MEAEKRRSKGGFLNLFDWNGKSRKKLFAIAHEELSGPRCLKEEKEDVENSTKPSNCTIDLDENEASSSNKGSGDWNSASCVTSEEDNGGASRAPSVVARLMGLDSMPSSSSSAQFSDSSPIRSSHHDRANNLRSEVYAAEYANMSSRFEAFSRNRVDLRSQRHHHNMPIERFQTEVLPPRSAKSISITHHKLLSPIKNPGFVSTKNASYIMEAGAKIIEASPRSSAKSKASLSVGVGTSSVPMRIRDLKEKIEAANKASSRTERPKEIGGSGSSKYGNKFRNGSEYVLVTRESMESESRNIQNGRVKGRSVSPSGQPKNGLQRNGYKNVGNRREVKPNPVSKSQPNAQRSEQKRNSPESSTNVLRPNNQKQNCVSSKEKLAGKNSVSRNLPRRTRSANGSIEPNKTPGNKISSNPKTGPRKASSASTVTQRRKLVSSSLESASNGSSLTGEAERSMVKCNISMESCSNMSPESRKPGMDVISFTFNSPLKKSPRESSRSSLEAKRFRTDSSIVDGDKDQSHHYSSGFTISSPGMNVIGADSLSALLEQKLLELTSKVQLYESNRAREESSGSCESRGKQVQISVLRDQRDSENGGYVSPHVDSPSPSLNHKWQESEECSGSSNNTGKELEYSDLSPESSFEISFESGTFTDNRSCTTTGSKGCSYSEAQSRITLSHDTDVLSESESAISSSAQDTTAIQAPRPSSDEIDWELEYVRDVLDNSELAAEEFATGGARGDIIIAGDLFERLESRWERSGEECSKKLGRKVVFDCVNECLDSRRSEGTWARQGWTRLPPRKDWLAEELQGEMSGWKGMCDWMLDELVENEMSTRLGRWLNFDQEAFEESVDIGEALLGSLVDDLVFDLMVF